LTPVFDTFVSIVILHICQHVTADICLHVIPSQVPSRRVARRPLHQTSTIWHTGYSAGTSAATSRCLTLMTVSDTMTHLTWRHRKHYSDLCNALNTKTLINYL